MQAGRHHRSTRPRRRSPTSSAGCRSRSTRPARSAPAPVQGGQAADARSACCPTSRPASTAPTLDAVFDHLTAYPEGFTPHPKLARQFETRAEAVPRGRRGRLGHGRGAGLRLAAARGHAVRLAGEDSRRGTFSQRHASPGRLRDRASRGCRSPTCPARRAKFWVYDSLLSEYAALGFEYGYSVRQQGRAGAVGGAVRRLRQRRPDHHRPVPRGRRGQVGPDDRASSCCCPTATRARAPSTRSARIERFLTLCAEDNIQVCNATTAAQYFHLLRRQMRRDVRKPLVAVHAEAAAAHEGEPLADRRPHARLVPGGARRPGRRRSATPCAAWCSARGKVACDAMAERDKRQAPVAVVRVEQLYPFPQEQLLGRPGPLPERQGAGVAAGGAREHGRLGTSSSTAPGGSRSRATTCGTWPASESGSPATGSATIHEQELADLMEDAFSGI